MATVILQKGVDVNGNRLIGEVTSFNFDRIGSIHDPTANPQKMAYHYVSNFARKPRHRRLGKNVQYEAIPYDRKKIGFAQNYNGIFAHVYQLGTNTPSGYNAPKPPASGPLRSRLSIPRLEVMSNYTVEEGGRQVNLVAGQRLPIILNVETTATKDYFDGINFEEDDDVFFELFAYETGGEEYLVAVNVEMEY